MVQKTSYFVQVIKVSVLTGRGGLQRTDWTIPTGSKFRCAKSRELRSSGSSNSTAFLTLLCIKNLYAIAINDTPTIPPPTSGQTPTWSPSSNDSLFCKNFNILSCFTGKARKIRTADEINWAEIVQNFGSSTRRIKGLIAGLCTFEATP